MRNNQRARNGKSQPRAAADPVTGGFDAIETVKDEWQVFYGDTCPRIADRTFDAILCGLNRDRNS